MTGPLVLGIESSCDETAVALVRGDRTILAQRIASQNEAHERFGGVVPELAARAHADRLAPMVETVLTEAGIALTDVDAIAGTAGPGLIGGVMVGLVSGKALAKSLKQALAMAPIPTQPAAADLIDTDLLAELFETLGHSGFQKVALKYWKDGLYEMYRSYSKDNPNH